MANFSTFTLTRNRQELVVLTASGELGFIVRDRAGYDAYANLPAKDGYARAVVEPFKRLRDAVAFIAAEGAAL
jgi:hypothetical protein